MSIRKTTNPNAKRRLRLVRKPTAKELHAMGVKGGPDLPLHPDSKVGLAKAKILSSLERLYGPHVNIWFQALKHTQHKPVFQREPYKTAVQQLLKELDGKEV